MSDNCQVTLTVMHNKFRLEAG